MFSVSPHRQRPLVSRIRCVRAALFGRSVTQSATGLLTAQQSCGKVMFLYLSVILFTGRGLCPGGVSVQGGLCPGGVSVWGGVSVRGVSVRETPRTAGATYPTGMHSCYDNNINS